MTLQERLQFALQIHRAGDLPQAEGLYRQLLAESPDCADALYLLGVIARQTRRFDEAVDLIGRAIRLNPSVAEYHLDLGASLRALNRFDEAVRSYQAALALRPDFAEAYVNLGNVLGELGRVEEAIQCCRRAASLSPRLFEAHFDLGAQLAKSGDLDGAIDSYRQALALRPDDSEALNNLANAYRNTGQVGRALECFQLALNQNAVSPVVESNRLWTLHFDPGCDAQALLREHRLWSQRQARSPKWNHQNDRDPSRRLRIGYVSPDFREHPVAWNFLPLLRCHNRDQIEAICYSSVAAPDGMTARLQGLADPWRDIAAMDDQRCAQAIQADRIDILVDLSLHTADNRLLVFARRPAPVQVTFMGYPGTSGLAEMDWRITDPYLDRIGETDGDYSERSYRLPGSFWCYDPQATELPANEPTMPPRMKNGYVTFGCLNHFSKVNDVVLALWGRVLQAVGGSRLVMLAPKGCARLRVLESLAAWGVDKGRIYFVDRQARPAYFQQYGAIDIGLDTIPYNGHTTSLDALWMGVPVISRVGRTVVGRAGWSQLSNLGLGELAAGSDEEFVRLAIELAADVPRLAELRRTLRQRMLSSPLCDAKFFTQSVEAAYRAMWRDWVKGK